jgi:nicotinamidase-related amidase
VGVLFAPHVLEAVQAGRLAALPTASTDETRVLLLLVDPQVDFIHAEGTLAVPGAIDDTRRTVEWIYRHARQITSITASLDTHTPIQIFYPGWWADENGQHPAPFTLITAADVDAGRWQPLTMQEWSRAYVRRLEEEGKKVLTIWPYHTMLGTPGHAITPALYEAIVFHSAARATEPVFLQKGMIPQTEHYSILEPEIKVPGMQQGSLNTALLERIAGFDRVFVAGQASSHCVLETLNSLVGYFGPRDPAVLERIHILTDCTSPVAHPSIDFASIANEAFARFTHQGIKLVTAESAVL